MLYIFRNVLETPKWTGSALLAQHLFYQWILAVSR